MTTESRRYSRYFTYIAPISKQPLVKSYGGPILTILASTIFILFAIKPTISTILVLQKQLSDSQQVLNQITQKSENLAKGKQNYQDLDTAIKSRIQIAIPDKLQVKTLTGSLEEAANTHQASISAVQIQTVVLDQKSQVGSQLKLSTVDFTFNVEGSYQNLVALLADLKKTPRLISIQNLTINKSPDGKTILMSVKGKAYFIQ